MKMFLYLVSRALFPPISLGLVQGHWRTAYSAVANYTQAPHFGRLSLVLL
jgi:hypothetical protein